MVFSSVWYLNVVASMGHSEKNMLLQKAKKTLSVSISSQLVLGI
jgi:hypothetical protein